MLPDFHSGNLSKIPKYASKALIKTIPLPKSNLIAQLF